MESRDELHGFELKEKSFPMLEPLNTLIRSLNEFILANSKLVQANKKLRADILLIAGKIYSVVENKPYFENEILSCLSTQGLTSIPRKLLPELEKSDLSYFTAYQFLAWISKLHQHLDEKILALPKDFLALAKHVKIWPALETSKEQLKKLEEKLAQNKNENGKIAKDNQTLNNNNFTVKLFARLPNELKDQIFSYINYNKLTAITKLRRISKDFYLFAQNEAEPIWCGKIINEFKLTADDIKQIKKENESFCSLYKRISTISFWCNEIRDFSWDIWHKHKVNEERYRKAAKVRECILEGFQVGVEALQKTAKQLSEELQGLDQTANAFNQVDPYNFALPMAFARANFR